MIFVNCFETGFYTCNTIFFTFLVLASMVVDVRMNGILLNANVLEDLEGIGVNIT